MSLRYEDNEMVDYALAYRRKNIRKSSAARQNMPNDWAIEGQIEQGKIDDKLHGQLFLKTPQTRGTKIAKFFPHSHIEEARNKFALQNYVHKEETRVGEFKTVENRSPQWSVVCDKFYDWLIIKTDYASQIRQDDEKLALWDEFIGLSIEEGMRSISSA